MYKHFCINTKTFHVADNADLERFYFHPYISTKSRYTNDDKSEALLEVEYRLECIFEDVLKEKLVFASVISQFTIIKNDDIELIQTSETVFDCVKTVEGKLEKLLASKDHGLSLKGLGIKPVAFQSWQKGNLNSGIGGFLN